MNVRTLTWLALACVLFGCHPANPLDQKVPANASIDLTLWRLNVGKSLDREQWGDFDDALQEIKFRMMLDHVASGSTAIDEAMGARISGRTVREVLQIGYLSKFDRLNIERKELEAVIEDNAKLRAHPDDLESENGLRQRRKVQSDQLAALMENIARTQEKLQKYEPDFIKNGPNRVKPTAPTTVTQPHE